MNLLEGEVAVITGASRGIGRATALELAREGAMVIVGYRENNGGAEQVVAEIAEMGGKAYAFQADVTNEQDVRKLIAFVIGNFERIDVLVCNAGIVKDQLIAAMRLEEWETVMATNLRGAFLCIREAVPHMMSRKKGSIINMSSVAADRAGRGQSNYAAAKGGLSTLTRSLAVELAPKKIRVNAVAPGVITTDMTKRIRNLAEQDILAEIPFGRFGEPEEVARAVRFLASSDASYVTGHILQVTGGLGL
ncbi:MAG: 3-oxoacyl-ACP reductase FabG [Gammaproteobacteria bacterium]